MTQKQFLHELQPLAKHLHVTSTGQIRTYSYNCPIVTLCENKLGKTFDNTDWGEAAEELGLSCFIASRIVSAADMEKPPVGAPNEIRDRMLEMMEDSQ